MGLRLDLPPLPGVAFALYVGENSVPWAARDDLVNLCRHAFQA
jgi:hypothetical protein